MNVVKRIGLVAHDQRKRDMIEWVEWNWNILMNHQLICTGTTGRLVEESLSRKLDGLQTFKYPVRKLKSGPLGGDQQLGAMIAEERVDLVIFFWDPMNPLPHDVDVKALLRIAVLYNVPIACNRATADYLISSVLMDVEYTPVLKDYSDYINRVMED